MLILHLLPVRSQFVELLAAHARTFRYEAVGLSLVKRILNHFHRILWSGSSNTTTVTLKPL
jgi:hypothetical protein